LGNNTEPDTQLQEAARTLGHFVDFLKREGAEIITSELALHVSLRDDVSRSRLIAAINFEMKNDPLLFVKMMDIAETCSSVCGITPGAGRALV
jgi:hypothetical protein